MRNKLLEKRIYVLLGLSLTSILIICYVANLADLSPLMGCTAKWGFINTPKNKYYTVAETIVVRPWLGQHNVYAVFMIPNGYQYEYLFKLNLPGERTYCGVIHRANQSVVDGVVAKPGYYLLKGYINTRIALSLMIQGKLNQLKQSQHWELGYVKKTPNS
ncbi:MAG TPA: hypothetical protein IGS40_22485 [Trichormus sp. M33_DOE_039]|nr:hypothetical protein [Trichormus sp. M33_DOE_039]